MAEENDAENPPASAQPAATSVVPAKPRTPADKVSLILLAAMFVFGAYYYGKVPEKITAYIGASDAGITPRLFGLFIVPVAGALLYLVLTYIPPMLAARGRKIPLATVDLLKPAALAYFAFTEFSIIAFNHAKVIFSPAQNMAVVLGIGIAYAGAHIISSKTNLFPRVLKNAGEETIGAFNERFGKALAEWSAVVFLGIFAEKYLIFLVALPAIYIFSSTLYKAYKLGKSTEISAVKKEVEGAETPKNAP